MSDQIISEVTSLNPYLPVIEKNDEDEDLYSKYNAVTQTQLKNNMKMDYA